MLHAECRCMGPHVCACACVPLWLEVQVAMVPQREYRISMQGPILKQNNEHYEMTNSMDLYMNNVPFLHIKVAWPLKPIALLRMLSL